MAEKHGNLSINSDNLFPIIKKWLYSDHDIFYRELISNGSDRFAEGGSEAEYGGKSGAGPGGGDIPGSDLPVCGEARDLRKGSGRAGGGDLSVSQLHRGSFFKRVI